MVVEILLVLLGVLALIGVGSWVYFRQTQLPSRKKEALSARPEPGDVDQPVAEVSEESRAEDLTAPGKIPGAEEQRAIEPKPLAEALAATQKGLLGRIRGLFQGAQLSSDQLEELEEVLYTSDLGPQTVQRLMSAIEDRLSSKEMADFEMVRSALRDEVQAIFSKNQPEHLDRSPLGFIRPEGPTVLMVVGVNGAGKTTSIGKLTKSYVEAGKKVLIAAGDRFRAAAGDQLKVWAERADADFFDPENVTDPSAVAYQACERATNGAFDVVIIDTAGRLHTQVNLMEELKKMKRVVSKVMPEAPHEILLVLDANSGQNALMQAKQFNEALGVTGVILTKLDGTAKGGVAVGVAYELGVPIRFIGVGEKAEDLRPFSSPEFVDSIL